MTNIAQTFASKAVVAFVAAAMIFTMFAPAAQAQSADDLQKMINDLLAQIATLQSQVGQGSTSVASGVCPYTWTRDLSQGSTGADVMKLQQFLNSDVDTRVAAEGAGSVGMETEYYGPATAAAVSKMQVKYRAEVLTPGGLMNPTGYFGPSSRAKANAVCTTAPVVVPGEEEEEEEGEEEMVELGGEGVLATFEMDDDEDEVQEGAEDEVVAEITVEADNGDIEIDRLYFTLEGTTGNDELDAYDVFEEVSLWVDGDKIASFDAADEDEYTDEDDGTFIFTGLDLVLMEDEEVEILVAVTVNSSVDGSDVMGDAEWTLSATEVRYFDADGVATNDTSVDELDPVLANTANVVFDIVEEGTDDDASIESNSDNPEAATILVEDDTTESDEYVVHIFDIEVDRDSSDLVLDDAFVDVTITNPDSVDIDGQDSVIAEIMMTIDGETVEGEAVVGAADEEGDAIDSSTTVRYRFEFDGLDLDADTDYEVEVAMVFEGTDDGDMYANSGVTIQTEVTDGQLWEVEGLADDNVLMGDDESEIHTLATVVPVITDDSFDVDRNEAGDAGIISYEFTLAADGENDYFFEFTDVDDVNPTGDAVVYSVTGGAAVYNAAITLISGDATASSSEGWIINDGDEATFVVDFVFASSSPAGAYRVNIDTVGGVEVDMTSSALNLN